MNSSTAQFPSLGTPQCTAPGNALALRNCGFTLIEVVIALGIVAIAFTSIVGLIPIGLSSSKSAVSNTVGANILSSVMNNLRQLDFSEIDAQPTQYWFDDQGFEVPKSDAVFEVSIAIASGQLPASTPKANDNLKAITLKIANNPGGSRTNIPDAETTRYTTYLARTESIADGTNN